MLATKSETEKVYEAEILEKNQMLEVKKSIQDMYMEKLR